MRGKDFTPLMWTGSADLDALLHPAQAYDHPDDVANDPDLSLNEKRAILASWASDACAVEAAPALRCAPGGKRVVSFDEVMEALRGLDREAQEQEGQVERPRRMRRQRWRTAFRARRTDDSGNDRQGPVL
jgi:hypothetical protein